MGKTEFTQYCKDLRDTRKPSNRGLFVKVPQVDFGVFNSTIARNRGYQVYPPTGLECLSNAVDGMGVDFDILDMNYHFLREAQDPSYNTSSWMKILDRKIEETRPGIVGVSNTFRMEEENFFDVLKYLRERKENPIIVVGGQNATYESQRILGDNLADFVCQREGEEKMRTVIDQLYGGGGLGVTPGILFNYNGKVLKTGDESDQVILKGSLVKQHKDLPIEDYHNVGTLGPFSRMAGDETPFAATFLNRGCRAQCNFCTVRDYHGIGVRGRQVEDVLEELSYLHFERGIGHFEFLDDDITRDKDRLRQVLGGIKKRGMNVSWSAQNGIIASSLDEQILQEMQDSNCIGFKIGIESGNPHLLKAIRKPGTIDSFRKFAQRARKFPGLFMSFNYIIGFPNEDFGMMRKTYDFSGEMNPDWSSFSTYIPLGENRQEGDEAENFIPVKSEMEMEIARQEEVVKGYDVFGIPEGDIPSREQTKEIWFTFNMRRNFMRNKNLLDGGDPKKFIRWMDVLQRTYSLNADMPFFLAMAHQLEGNEAEAEGFLDKTKGNMTPYWKERFDQFGLTPHLDNFPNSRTQARETLEFLANNPEGFD